MTDPEKTGGYQPDTLPSPAEQAPPPETPSRIGRYRVERCLGRGGFGLVYLARDEQLDRPVAIKVPYAALVERPEDAEAYLIEARTVAQLDHPHIVPVYDFGSDEQCPCYIVSKFIEGSSLAEKLQHERLSLRAAAELVAAVAEALHHAHHKGVVHRDVKPGNILLDRDGKPFVTDFGLALKEENLGRGPRFAGTATYMSPEQARGEGHRVDGRSDIFSLGVVLYELLVGRRPFKGDSKEELLARIADLDPRPPRQVDDTIPKELERICLKALAKRASERYLTAKDMADDLRLFSAEMSSTQITPVSRSEGAAPAAAPHSPPSSLPLGEEVRVRGLPPSMAASSGTEMLTSETQLLRIIPKGLRSFDAHDADFFLALLPGPRDRDGLPDSIRFWKARCEEIDTDNTTPVCLIYGPSGCGKSSLVKAGLLPRLSNHVRAVYVEATFNGTETRLLTALRKRCPALPPQRNIKEALTALRQGQGVPPGQKVLIVLDQFEQWLHAHRGRSDTELVQALRQCDGGRLQCVVLVRDDFWMAATRFMHQLEIPLLEGQNSAAIDLFDLDHARKVLAAFGRAFGRLPEGVPTREERTFLHQAVAGLAREGKIICVRLALFAEMMKGKHWTPASLKAAGGAAGVGVTFLEETFSAATAPLEHRYHQKAARAVLQALLPESGTDIKGNMRSREELLRISGYAARPREFEDLLRILDNELRLITPTDPEGEDAEPQPLAHARGSETPSAEPRPLGSSHEPAYQLTHDYLVPALRSWLTRKRKETRRGRAELILADRAAEWNARPESRILPSPLQWLSIHALVPKKGWTEPQRKMMSRADRHYIVRGLGFVGLLTSLLILGLAYRRQTILESEERRASDLVARLLDSHIDRVPDIVRAIEPYRAWTDPLLRQELERTPVDPRHKLRASLGLLPVDPKQVDYVYSRLLDSPPRELPVLCDALLGQRRELMEKFWAAAERPPPSSEGQRLRAACALAQFDPFSPRWANIQEAVANDLVGVHAIELADWLPLLRPVRERLYPPLSVIFHDRYRPESEHVLVTDILAEFFGDVVQALTDLLLDADEKAFEALFAKFRVHREDGLPRVFAELDKQTPPDGSEETKDRLARRQANAAVTLLRLNQSDRVWPLLRHSRDPRRRSYLIHRLGPLGADAKEIRNRLDVEKDLSILRALLLSLGEFNGKRLPADVRAGWRDRVREIFRTAPDPGLHAAARWLLVRWNDGPWVRRTEEDWAKDKPEREKRLKQIRRQLAEKKEAAPGWYVNSQGQTMVVIPIPEIFSMGSADSEAGRAPDETLHHRRIGRAFEISMTPVTLEQFRRLFPKVDEFLPSGFFPKPDCPIGAILWCEAAEYCNRVSESEGIPKSQWCYEPNKQGKYDIGMKLADDAADRSGYRLPTEAEWEYAVRAGATTSRPYGGSEELLEKYAWYLRNSLGQHTLSVASLKPNDLGLFDGLGNVWVWCQDKYGRYFEGRVEGVKEDTLDRSIVRDKEDRVQRGGSYGYGAQRLRCADRGHSWPVVRGSEYGLRIARTFR